MTKRTERKRKAKGSRCSRREAQLSVVQRHKESASKLMDCSPDELMTAKEVAELLGVSRNCVQQRLKKGIIRNYGVGQVKFYRRSEVISPYTG